MMELPADRTGSPEAMDRFDEVTRSLGSELADGLVELASTCGCSPAQAFVVATLVFLARMSSRSDASARWLDEGHAVSLDLNDRPSFVDAVGRLLESGSACNVACSFASGSSPAVPAPAGLDLRVHGRRDGGVLELRMEYRSDRFDRSTMARWLGHLETLLRAAIARPGEAVSRLPLLTPEQRHTLVVEWNDTAAAYPAEPFHELVSQQAARTPALPAVFSGDEQITYAQLERRSNRLARLLRARGVRAEKVVAVFLERSVDSMVAMIAILKAGGGYFPLDPDHPRERLRFMLDDAAPSLVLTDDASEAKLPSPHPPAVHLRRDAAEIDAYDDGPLRVRVHPDDLAYVLYTSGSTGSPKGVLTAHRGWSNIVAVVRDGFDVRPGERALLYHNIAFDYTIWEVSMAMPFGVALYVTRAEEAGALQLARVVEQRKINIMSLTPSSLQFLGGRDFPSVRIISSGAESCPLDLARYWAERCEFYHGYGPTEFTTGCAYERYPGEGPVRIGRPMQNDRIHVLDEQLEPVPIGVVGEIYLGGIGIARGYLGRPGLTAERFVPNPFAEGERLYRTGDLARLLPDGAVVFAGRVDDQVKIGGFRIELGEIEATLASHPQVSQAAVVLMARTKELVAYLVPTPGATLERRSLSEHVAGFLPSYMHPLRYEELGAIPLTSNGKADRKALLTASTRSLG